MAKFLQSLKKSFNVNQILQLLGIDKLCLQPLYVALVATAISVRSAHQFEMAMEPDHNPYASHSTCKLSMGSCLVYISTLSEPPGGRGRGRRRCTLRLLQRTWLRSVDSAQF